ncbi:30S ribosomal protein S13 [Metarhizium acridum CQMa 102]|uniref:30S ribosomal protein S13 n=1 Tax=Metarhizium acridum (strain CQMa 102) TaxID=655827 RepID=E9DXS3_METAQ|nr:30S ribosomal protein S13 [Metarhizium acridum CQMa 102]EFY91536.1 30S ribosomal protein S13 [Metarhizium acridum CQMa 102]
MAKYSIHKLAKVGSLSPRTVTSLTAELSQMTIETDARRIVQDNIRRLKDIGSYRGRRHAMGLPNNLYDYGKNVATNDPSGITATDADPRQGSNQVRILGNVLKCLGHRVDATKVEKCYP